MINISDVVVDKISNLGVTQNLALGIGINFQNYVDMNFSYNSCQISTKINLL